MECASVFSYLGSQISSDGQLDTEVEKSIAVASRAFGALRHAVFHDSALSLTTKRFAYQTCVLSVLLTVWWRVLDILLETSTVFSITVLG